MNRRALLTLTATIAITAPATAGHILHLGTPYASRGECEAAVADYSSDDREMLLNNFPNYFASNGEVASFLTRAFPCVKDSGDKKWYIEDHRQEVIDSDWFQRR